MVRIANRYINPKYIVSVWGTKKTRADELEVEYNLTVELDKSCTSDSQSLLTERVESEAVLKDRLKTVLSAVSTRAIDSEEPTIEEIMVSGRIGLSQAEYDEFVKTLRGLRFK